jgi:hypothetical protein
MDLFARLTWTGNGCPQLFEKTGDGKSASWMGVKK